MSRTKKIQEEAIEMIDGEAPQTTGPQAPKTQLIGYKQEFMEQLLNYLASKPYGEVAGFVQGIQQGQPVEL